VVRAAADRKPHEISDIADPTDPQAARRPPDRLRRNTPWVPAVVRRHRCLPGESVYVRV
jgi:hypothetical protein